MAKSTSRDKTKSISSIAEFAEYLGLSAWTVSRAINGHPEVNPKTREHILAAMEEIGFRPNPMARGLRGQRTGLIGVSVAGFGSAMLNAKIYHLQEFLRRNQYRTLLEFSVQDPKNEVRVIKDFFQIRVDGIVLIYSGLPKEKTDRLLKGSPCVMIDPYYPQEFPTVAVNRELAMRAMFDHLWDLGHRRFALLGISKEEPWRWPGLLAAARHHGLDPEKIFTHHVSMPMAERAMQAGRAMAAEVLKLPTRPTALIAIDDRVAIGAIQALKEAGVRVPSDVSVTGFDNLDLARELSPTLTTVEQNPGPLMSIAGDLLIRQLSAGARDPLDAGAERISLAVAPQMIVGESTGPAPGAKSKGVS